MSTGKFKNKCKIITLTVLLLMFSTMSYSQIAKIEFENISTENGLSNGNITAIIQDSLGFIWFGTAQGLNRYDGYANKKFYNFPGKDNSLPDDNIRSLVYTPDSILWIGTNSKGLVSFDLVSNRFVQYNDFLYNSKDGTYPRITKLFYDKEKYLWLATNDGKILRLNYSRLNDKIELKNIDLIIRYVSPKKNIGINDICSLSQSNMLIGTDQGLYKLNIDKDLNVVANDLLLDRPVIKIESIYNKIILVAGFRLEKVYIAELPSSKISNKNLKFVDYTSYLGYNKRGKTGIIGYKNKIFFAIEQFGLISFTQDMKDKVDELDLSSKFENIRHFRISGLFVDKSNKLWLRTDGLGALAEQNNQSFFHTIKNIPGDISSISPTSLRQMVEDPASKGIWITGYRGVSLFQPQTGNVKRYPFNLSMYSIALIPNNKNYFLLGTDAGGIFLGNKESGESKFLNLVNNSSALMAEAHVFSIYIDSSQNVWIGTNRGFMKFGLPENLEKVPDKIETEIIPVLGDETKENIQVYQIFPLTKNLYYLASQKHGLVKFDLIKNSFEFIKNDPQNPRSISTNSIKTIYLASDSICWVGTTSGLNKWEKKDFKNFNNKFEKIYAGNGLPNNVVYGILEDRNQKLWLSTNFGLSRFDPKENVFYNFLEHNGLANDEFNTRSYLKTSSAEMYFGGIYGLTFFNPENIINNADKSKIIFTDIKVLNKEFTTRKDFSYFPEVELAHDENTFSVSFSALNYHNGGITEYSYQLEGEDPSWIDLGHNREVAFTNVSAGNYKLRVRSRTPFTEWPQDFSELSIIIHPPIWKTWWMYTIYAFIIIGAAFLLRKNELRMQKHQQAAEIERVRVENLLELDRAKSDFFANISHELRTPLTLILGMIESIKRTLKSDIDETVLKEIEKKLDIADKSGNKELSMVNQILDLTRIDAGKEKFNPVVKNIEPIIRSIFASFESLVEINNIDLHYTSNSNNILVKIDEDKFEKILNNLLSNSIKFTPKSGQIYLEVISDPENSNVEIIVKDTGIGISEENLPHIFDRFYQADNSSTRKYEGIGIGLSLTKELIELHNGKISVESNPGEGTKFIVLLPIDQSNQTDENSNSSIAVEETYSAKSGQKTNEKLEISIAETNDPEQNSILIIEDNADLRFYIKDSLKMNFNILEAPDGKIGLEYAEKDIPDLIITDLMMPNMDGYELTKNLRENNITSHIPIIMITARASADDKLSGFEAGVDAYLTKPFSTKELNLRVRKILELRKNLYQKIGNTAFSNPVELKLRSLDQIFLQNLRKIVLSNISNEKFSIDELSEFMAISKRQLNRKLKALLEITPGAYIRKLRLIKAKELLENGTGNVSEISLEVGYSNFTAFSKAFKEEFGIPPSQIAAK